MSNSKSQKKLKKAMSGKALTAKEQAKKAAPRNLIVKAMVEQRVFQSSAHKNKKALSKRGQTKHSTHNYGY